MEYSGGGYEEGSSSSTPARWVAPVDPITGVADTRLCFLYADLWRRVVDPGTDGLEPLQAWALGGGRGRMELGVAALYRDRVAPEIYDAVLGAMLTAVKRLDLRYTFETPEEGSRCVGQRGKRLAWKWVRAFTGEAREGGYDIGLGCVRRIVSCRMHCSARTEGGP